MTYNGFPTTINVVQNDYGYSLPFTLQDSTGAVINLTNVVSVNFNCQLQSNDGVTFDNPMSVTSQVNGQVAYTVLATDFVLYGTWNAQIVVTFVGEVITFTGIQIIVAPVLPVAA